MKQLIRKMLNENLVNEDIDDLPKQLTDKSYIAKIANKLGYNLIGYLDSGNNGSAYILNDNKVLKITTDKTEFLVASKLKGKTLERISNVYETYKINNLDVYIIILERLEPLSDELISDLDTWISKGDEFRKTNLLEITAEINEIKAEIVSNGVLNPNDYSWWMNMGLKKGKLAVFDIGDKTIDYNNFETIDLSNL